MKEGLELLPSNRNFAFGLVFLLVLLPTEVDAVTQERCCKKNAIEALSSGGSKVILALMVEVIAFHVGLTTIDVK